MKMNDIPDFLIIKRDSEFIQNGLSKELSDKLEKVGIHNLQDLKYSYEYINELSLEEFDQLRKYFIANDFIIGNTYVDNVINQISDELAFSLCSKIPNYQQISIDNLKIRINLAYLFLLENQRKIINYQFFSSNKPILHINSVADYLQEEQLSVMIAGKMFFNKILEPIRGDKLCDYLS